jgi:polar amino acid transport system substrate-binding protein
MACTGSIAGALAGVVLAASQPVIVGTDGPFPAYVHVDAAGEITGFERDVMDEVCARAALSCDWKLTNFDQLIPGVMAGEFDVVLGGIAVNNDRRTLVDFTVSYYRTDDSEWYIGRPGAPEPPEALTGVQTGTVHEAHLRKLGYRFIAFRSEPEVLQALATDQVDLALGPYQTRADIAEFLIGHAMDFLYVDDIPDDGVAMAVCKGNPLLGQLNRALRSMLADGTIAAYEARWFH